MPSRHHRKSFFIKQPLLIGFHVLIIVDNQIFNQETARIEGLGWAYGVVGQVEDGMLNLKI